MMSGLPGQSRPPPDARQVIDFRNRQLRGSRSQQRPVCCNSESLPEDNDLPVCDPAILIGVPAGKLTLILRSRSVHHCCLCRTASSAKQPQAGGPGLDTAGTDTPTAMSVEVSSAA